MAGPAPGTIVGEDYFGNAPEWGEETDGGQQQEDDSGGEDDAEVQQECLHKFSTRDYIMEPSIFNTLKRYFQAGGSPENVIQLLSENYTAVAQTVNLLAEWLIQTGVEPVQVQETVENHLKSLLIKHFDPRKADSIFTEEGGVLDGFSPLPFVSLALTGKQKAGVCALIGIDYVKKMVCHGSTHLFAQAMMSVLAQEEQGGSAVQVAQEVSAAQEKSGAFLDLFMQSLFKPGAKINQDHKHKYIHIPAASVVETWKKISTCHQLLHPQVLQLLVKLFETEHSQLDVMEQLELKKTLLDRMVHLLSRGYVLPVVSYIRRCLEKLDTDISLIRYFVTEVLDVIAPPYTSDFVQLFLPILENDSIAGTIKAEGEHDPVTEFIAHCKSNFIVMN
ncbi:hypothetical protein STEG23_017639 [Scotinomys teguina]